MSDTPCTHDFTRVCLDTPIFDAETQTNLGRFDVVICIQCGEFLEKQETKLAPPPPLNSASA